MKKKTITTLMMLMIFVSVKAQFQPDGSFHAGSYFKLTPSGRVNGNLIFSKPTDQNSGIIRGSSLGMEFLTYTGGIWYQRMTIALDGDVGIGTTSPEEPLHVDGTGIDLVNDDLRAVTQFGKSSISKGLYLGYSNAEQMGTIMSDGASSGILFQSHDGSSWAERMRIHTNGNIGIGTTSPEELLHVDGTGIDLVNDDLRAVTQFGKSSISKGLYLGYSNTEQMGTIMSDGASSGILFQSHDGSSWAERMRIHTNGNVGIGTIDPKSKLAVAGQIRATEVKVLTDVNSVPDYVFESDYDLRTLKETKEYITENKHLPEIPSADEIGENGIDLGDMNMKLLKKIEELTLHLIEQSERVEKLEKEVQALKD